MCDFDCCDFGICDFNTCDFDTCDVGTCDFNTTNPLVLNLPLAALILNSEQKKKAKKKAGLNAERRNNMNTTSTDKPCECNNAHHRAYKVMVIDVPQSSENTKKRNTSCFKIPGTSSRLTHQFVDIYFKCNNCRCEFSCVSEFDNNGKHWYWHNIGESRRQLAKQYLLGSEIMIAFANIDRSYKFVKDKYDEMPNKGCFVKKYTSIQWANKFYNRLI